MHRLSPQASTSKGEVVHRAAKEGDIEALRSVLGQRVRASRRLRSNVDPAILSFRDEVSAARAPATRVVPESSSGARRASRPPSRLPPRLRQAKSR